MDETVTRDKAVESVKIVLGVIPPMDDKVQHVFLGGSPQPCFLTIRPPP